MTLLDEPVDQRSQTTSARLGQLPLNHTASRFLRACMQCGLDLLDGPITIIHVFIDSAAPATQNGVSKMSTVL